MNPGLSMSGRLEMHDSFSSEGLGFHSGGSRGSMRGEGALPPPGILTEIDPQEVNRIFVRSDRLNRCATARAQDQDLGTKP